MHLLQSVHLPIRESWVPPRMKRYATSMKIVSFILWVHFLWRRSSLILHYLWDISLEVFGDISFATSPCKLGICEGLPMLVWLPKRKKKLWPFSFISLDVTIVLWLKGVEGLMSLESFVCGFGPLPKLQHFELWFFLVTPSTPKLMP